MIRSLQQLRAISEKQLTIEHDELAKNTVVGTNYYMQELDRRSRERFEKVTIRLTYLSATASIAAVITSIIALYE